MKAITSIIFTIVISLIVLPKANAQTYNEVGSLNIIASYDVEKLVRKHIYINENNKKTRGFRIQLIQNSQRDKVLEKKAKFLNKFPDVKTYLSYNQPYFKLRTGDFESRLMAYPFYRQVLRSFSNAILVPDVVNIQL